jgi:hypothetical protein
MIVVATMILHNYIREHESSDINFDISKLIISLIC